MNRRGYMFHTNKFHHGLSENILTHKLGIDLDKVKCTIEPTTQENIRSDIKPLTGWYIIQTYFIRSCVV